MPAGRPSEYDPSYCDSVVSFLRDGYSLAAYAGEIGVARSTIYEWMKDQPEFSDAVKRGQAGAALWWERLNRNFAISGEGNATAIIFGLKNRAADDWRDKTETEHSGSVVTEIKRTVVRPEHTDR